MTRSRHSKPEILAQIRRDLPVVIEASAGTGKTYTIEHLVIELLLEEKVGINEILVLTFTERAATELRQRIRRKISQILAKSREDSDPEPLPLFDGDAWEIDLERRAVLERALYGFDGASIGTIHGFFGSMLVEHAFEDGRLFEETLEDGQGLFGKAFLDALRRQLAKKSETSSQLLEIWLEEYSGPESLAELLYKCHASRRHILPPFSLEKLQAEVDVNALFTLNIPDAIEPVPAPLKAAKGHHSTTNSIRDRLLPAPARGIARRGGIM